MVADVKIEDPDSDAFAERDDVSCCLMAGHQREDGPLELSIEHVRVGAANTHGCGLDKNLFITRFRLRSLLERNLTNCVENNRAHLCSTPLPVEFCGVKDILGFSEAANTPAP